MADAKRKTMMIAVAAVVAVALAVVAAVLLFGQRTGDATSASPASAVTQAPKDASVGQDAVSANDDASGRSTGGSTGNVPEASVGSTGDDSMAIQDPATNPDSAPEYDPDATPDPGKETTIDGDPSVIDLPDDPW